MRSLPSEFHRLGQVDRFVNGEAASGQTPSHPLEQHGVVLKQENAHLPLQLGLPIPSQRHRAPMVENSELTTMGEATTVEVGPVRTIPSFEL